MSQKKLPLVIPPFGLWENFRDWLLPSKIDSAPKRAALLCHWAGRAVALAELDLSSALAAFQKSYDKAKEFVDKRKEAEVNAHTR